RHRAPRLARLGSLRRRGRVQGAADRRALAPAERQGDRRLRGSDEATQRRQGGAARRRWRAEGRPGVDRRRRTQVPGPRRRGAPAPRPDRRRRGGADRKAAFVLAHAGEGPPARVEGLLARNPNLIVDLSGMHFQRMPALATETGPLDPAWKALLEKMPDRFLMGIDVWAPRLFEPAMLDRLFTWTRRILGELAPGVAEQVAHRNAAALFHAE